MILILIHSRERAIEREEIESSLCRLRRYLKYFLEGINSFILQHVVTFSIYKNVIKYILQKQSFTARTCISLEAILWISVYFMIYDIPLESSLSHS
jgi:hypothetical protein